MYSEKREYERVDICVHAVVTVRGEQHRVTSRNLSAGGMAIALPALVNLKDTFRISFPASAKGIVYTVEADCRVVHVHLMAEEQLYFVGVQFNEIGHQNRLYVDQYVREVLRLRKSGGYGDPFT